MAIVQPVGLFSNLEFDKISSLLMDLCLIEDTRKDQFPLPLYTDKKKIESVLDEVMEFKNAYELDEMIPVRACVSITESLEYLGIQEYVLEQEALIHLLQVLVNLEEIKTFFGNPERAQRYPLANTWFKKLDYQSDLYKEFKIIFDDQGQVKRDASPALKSIYSQIKAKEYDIDQVFKSLMYEYRKNGWLSESGESIRNNRRVVAVNAEHKRKIKGIIHDESGTGRTTFIEPEAIIEKNNELFDLEMEYQKEIYRLLKILSAHCHARIKMLSEGWNLILQFDLLRAKALLASRYQGYRPNVFDRAQLRIKTGRHPLLFLKNQPMQKPTVPFDLILLGENRILILSGPNAGGKSVVMKATLLIQMMMQAGMLIPVHEDSEMGIFHSFHGDIGDHQSLEEDLSTYSSRLLLMKNFLAQADARSLIAIDEFGSGTDPKLGGAIAESILYALNKKKVFGVITTHYSNLKVMAFKTKGLINGAMVFDTDLLKPTFQLKIGRPGSSYAFEVATRSGLESTIIEAAKQRTQQDQKELEELLIDLQREKLILDEQLIRSKAKEDHLDKLIKTYEHLSSEFELKRKKLKLDQKTWEINAAKDHAYRVEKSIQEIKRQSAVKPALPIKQLEKEKSQVLQLESEIKSLHTEIKQLEKHHARPIKIGTHVRLKNGSETGQVLTIKNDQCEVAMGVMTLTIALKELVAVREPVEQTVSKTKTILTEEKSVDPTLDIRGMSKAQALELLHNYIDRALLSNVHELKILHGKGTGILRDVVKSQVKQYKAIKQVSHPPQEAGGDGISILHLS